MEWSAVDANKRVGFILRMEDMTPATGSRPSPFAPGGNSTAAEGGVWTMNGNAGMNPVFPLVRPVHGQDGRPLTSNRFEKSQETR